MAVMNELIDFFGLESVSELENFAQFVPWFIDRLLAVFIVCFIMKCLFTSVWKIERGIGR